MIVFLKLTTACTSLRFRIVNFTELRTHILQRDSQKSDIFNKTRIFEIDNQSQYDLCLFPSTSIIVWVRIQKKEPIG